MTKVKGPLFSIAASGSISNTITYSNNKGTHRVIAKTFRKDNQITYGNNGTAWFKKGWIVFKEQVRTFNYFISDYCNGLTNNQVNMWKRSSYSKQLNGISYFQKQWIKRSIQGLPQFQLPDKIGFCLSAEWICGFLTCGGHFIMGG